MSYERIDPTGGFREEDGLDLRPARSTLYCLADMIEQGLGTPEMWAAEIRAGVRELPVEDFVVPVDPRPMR